MAYEPLKAFLSGACSVLGRSVFEWDIKDRPLGFPGTEGSEAALAAAMRGLDEAPSLDLFERHRRIILEAQALELRQMKAAVALALTGQLSATIFALGSMLGTVAVAMAGHDVLAFGPILSLFVGMVAARRWLDRAG